MWSEGKDVVRQGRWQGIVIPESFHVNSPSEQLKNKICKSEDKSAPPLCPHFPPMNCEVLEWPLCPLPSCPAAVTGLLLAKNTSDWEHFTLLSN